MKAAAAIELESSAPGNTRRNGESKRPGPTRLQLINACEVQNYQNAWWSLSDCAMVPNAFYDPWMLLPAILAEPTDNIRFLLVWGKAPADGAEPLWGFFPLEIQSRCLHLPIQTLAFWQHRNCRLTVPLIDREHVWEVLDAFWRWYEKNPFRCRILDTNYLPSAGCFHDVWADFAIGRSSMVLRDFARAYFIPNGDGSAYIARRLSKKHFDEYLRLERRLSEIGKLEYRRAENASEVDPWIDEFLRLEAAGWKGGEGGNAFAKSEMDSSYFRKMTHAGFAQDRVMLLSLSFDGKIIAMKHNLLAGNGGFAFRIAFDERYSKYSPGVLLELENIRLVSRQNRIQWLDSCTKPRHVMADRIWGERRMIRRTLFSDGSRQGDLWIASLPLLRWVHNQFGAGEEVDYLKISTKS
jgi:CelD/BcsL family acetyltransferase involved in cellulose biosynthesis